ncbi:MAG: hypothetical protein KIG56_03495, partial [Bacteroidales bacterium]|nr:hypothetical protein [Bacteroidales bacterium]
MSRYNTHRIMVFAAASVLLLSSCNDDFLEKYPTGTLVESNAFNSYDNFKAYMYQCYALFTD